jgi:hypothetical protein
VKWQHQDVYYFYVMPLTMTQRIAAILVGAGLIVVAFAWKASQTVKIRFVTGAVLAKDPDPHKQRPIQNATVIAEYGETTGKAVSDSMGYFRLRLEPEVPAGEPMRLRTEHPNYRSFATVVSAGDQIHVIRLERPVRQGDTEPAQKQVVIGNVRIRYATKSTSTVNVAGVVRTFDIQNKGNVACDGQQPCSPDGKWRATLGSISVDAGEENKYFRNARVSCIAGPCSFTSIEKDGFSRGGRVISVVVRNWSDRVTYVLEAEVAQTIQSDLIRHAYPVILGNAMNFTLPASAQGPSIEAEVDGAEVVFPLGPKLHLSWAKCRAEPGSDGSRLYRCELKNGFEFR